MEPIHDRAIILKTTRYEERSLIIHAMTENHGHVSALAKNGIQSKRFAGALDLCSASQWIFTRKSEDRMLFLKEAKLIKSFESIRNHYELLALASLLNEILLKVTHPNENAKALFQLHSNTLVLIDEKKPEQHCAKVFSLYFSKILSWLGFFPQWKQCFYCEGKLAKTPSNKEVLGIPKELAWAHGECFSDQSSSSEMIFPIPPQALIDAYLGIGLPIRKSFDEAMSTEKENLKFAQYLIHSGYYHVPGMDQSPLKSLSSIFPQSTALQTKGRPPQNPHL